MATIGVILGMMRSVFSAPSLSYTSGMNMVVGWLGGMVIGGMLGMSHERRSNGILIGVFVGGITGLTSGAATGGAGVNVPVILVGSAAILVFAAVVQAANRSRPPVDDGSSASPGKGESLRRRMSPRTVLAWALILLTAAYAVSKLVEVVQDRVYLNAADMAGRLIVIAALLALAVFLARLVLRAPAGATESTELSAIDILDEPRRGA